MSILSIAEKVGLIFALILVGFVFGKLIKGTDKDTHLLSKLVLNVAVPASIIVSISRADFDTIKHDLLSLVLIPLCVMAFTFICALLFTRITRTASAPASIYRSALMFNNYIFMGWPICALLFEQGMLYATLYAVPMHLVLFVITPAMLGRGESQPVDWRLVINMPLIATVAGVILLVLRLKLPLFLSDLLGLTGSLQTPLSMMIIGMIIASAQLKSVMKGLRLYLYSALRLLIIPAAVFLALSALGFSGIMLGVPVVLAAMPAGTLVVVLAQKHNADALLASRLVIISTLLSVATIPILAWLVL